MNKNDEELSRLRICSEDKFPIDGKDYPHRPNGRKRGKEKRRYLTSLIQPGQKTGGST